MPDVHSTDQAHIEREQRTIARALRVYERRAKYGRQKILGIADARVYLRIRLDGLEHEEFWALWLSCDHCVIADERLFIGTIDQTSVYPREVVKRALERNAAAVIFAHNHPSGSAEPSPSDIELTRKLADALGLVGVKVLDHFIVGLDPAPTSFAARGLI